MTAALCGALAAAVLLSGALWLRLCRLRRAVREMADGFADRLATGSNTLIDLPCRDPAVRRLGETLNTQLRLLRRERQRFRRGDAELKQAVTNLSHDLRTPLTGILGYLDLLEREALPPGAARYLAVIRERADLMKQLTEELFRYSVVLTGEAGTARQPVSLSRALEESLAAFYLPLSARGITPKIHLPAEPVVRLLDPGALARVLANLLSNAVKYSDGDLEVTLSETGELCFVNTAAGLSEIEAGRLFDRFYTVETARGSTGLGLSIARVLTERMGGALTADYRSGRLFLYLRFPPQAGASAQ